MEPVTSNRSTLSLAAGVYWITIATKTCVAKFAIAAFAGATRIIPVSLQRQPVTNGVVEDPYIVPGDFVMVDVPANSMAIVAAMHDGRLLSIELQGRKAFVDYVPAGQLTISVVLANALESKEVISTGDWRLHVVRF